MPLAPVLDRTITLTLESGLTGPNAPQSLLQAAGQQTRNFVNNFLPVGGVGGALVSKLITTPTSLVLVGPTAISIDMAAGVADEPGLATAFLQPWYIENIPIVIRGQSYLGAYPLLSVADQDLANLVQMFRTSLNDFSAAAGSPGNRQRVQLEISGYPNGLRRWLGFIEELKTDEDIKTANMVGYTLNFIGRNADNAQLAKGKFGATADKNVANGNTNG